MKKRILSILMALSLTLSLLPTAAFADEDGSTEDNGASIVTSEETGVLSGGEDDTEAEQVDASGEETGNSVPMSASGRDTVGYGGEALPAGPDMSGSVVTVTPENAQYTLDGAYGSINGKTIHFSTGTYEDVLELARPTKFSDSGTTYYKDGTAVDYENLSQTGVYTYARTVSNVTFTADAGAVISGFKMTLTHIYEPESDTDGYDYVRDTPLVSTTTSYYPYCTLSDVVFNGLTITDQVVFSDYFGTQAALALDAEITDITFQNCTFLGNQDKMADNTFAAIKMNADSEYFHNITVTGCTFTNYYQGVYVQGVDGLTVENCSISNTTHNAIAVQSSGSNPVRGSVTISGTTIQGTGDRAIRFGNIGEDVSAVIENNTFIDATDLDGELMKTGTTGDGFSLALENNQWTEDGAAKTEAELFEAMGVSAVAEVGGAIYSSLSGAVGQAASGETVKLLAPAEISNVIEIERDLTLDLNGYQITNKVTDDSLFRITEAVDVTVDGTAESSGMTIPSGVSSDGFFTLTAPASLTLDGGTYEGAANEAFILALQDPPQENNSNGNPDSGANGCTIVLNNLTATTNRRITTTDTLNTMTMEVRSGSYTSTAEVVDQASTYSVFGWDCMELDAPISFTDVTVKSAGGACIEGCGGTVTLENCDFAVNNTSYPGFTASAVAVSWEGTANIVSGSYTSAGYGAYVYSSGGTINILGGTVSGATAAVMSDVDSASYDNPATVNISGGTIQGALKTNGNVKATISVSGGTFDQAVPKEYCAPGMIPSGDASSGYTETTDTSIFASGNGTATNPFVIDGVDRLEAFRDSVNTGTTYKGQYIQLAEGTYELSGGDWTPIGNGTRSGSGYSGNSFQGYFDGNGQTITGLKNTSISDANAAVGLFGVVDGGTVENLTFTNVQIEVSAEQAGSAVGILLNGGTVRNVTAASGSIQAAQGAGGIVGRILKQGSVSNCENSAEVKVATQNAGGIVGAAYYNNEGMTISDCTNSGAVSGPTGIGGIVGFSSSDISGCTNSGTVTGNGPSIGGIAGEQQNSGSVTGCTNSGTITNESEDYGTGGIVGWVRYSGGGTLYPDKEIIEIRNNTNSGTISGGSDGGGIVGTVYNAAVVTGNENTAASISGTTFAAGIVGNLQSTETPDGGIPENDIQVVNNVSTTPPDKITAAHTSQYAYKNQGDEEKVVVDENSTEWVAQIGEQKYATLQTAVDAAKASDTIQVLRNVELSETLTITNKTLTIQSAEGQHFTISNASSGGIDGGRPALISSSEGGLTLKDLTFTGGVINVAHADGAVVAENCIFEDTTVKQSTQKDGMLQVTDMKAGSSLTVTGCTFEDLKMTADTGSNEFVAIYNNGTPDSITVTGSTFRNIAGTALSLRGSDDITITGNTFENWADESIDNAGRAVRVDFGSRTGEQSLTFTENKLIAGTNAKESYVKIGEIAENNADKVTLNVGKNYWDGKDPATGTVNSTETPVLEIVMGGETLTSDELRTNDSITGEDTYYIRDTMRPEDLNTYVPPVNPDGGNSGGSSDSEPSYSPVIDITGNGTIKVSPRTPSEGDEVTITPDPDNGYEVGSVTVTDRSGREVDVTANRNGTYTFTQPAGRVTIEVTFVRTGESTFFTDVPETFWAYDEIAWAYENGYVNGVTATTFNPNGAISRQQVWMILARLSGYDPADMAAARAWAMENGVSDGTNPGNAVTRQQLVALLFRFAELRNYANDQRADLSVFPDVGTVAEYAVEPMQWSVANDIVGGTTAGTLNPEGTATRAQFAVILYRFWDQIG